MHNKELTLMKTLSKRGVNRIQIVIKDLFILVLISILFMYGVYINNLNITIGCITFLLGLNVAFALKYLKKRFIFLIFQITFFTFVVGRLFLYHFFPDNNYMSSLEFNFSNDIMNHCLISIFISLIFVRLGYGLAEVFSNKNKNEPLDYETGYNQSIRKISKTLMYLSLCPPFINVD